VILSRAETGFFCTFRFAIQNAVAPPPYACLDPFLQHRIRGGDDSAMQTNLIANYYVPGPQAEATQTEGFKSGGTGVLKLRVLSDHREARVGEVLSLSSGSRESGLWTSSWPDSRLRNGAKAHELSSMPLLIIKT
jgi:hypothetical protein